jgi:hypothetical protein
VSEDLGLPAFNSFEDFACNVLRAVAGRQLARLTTIPPIKIPIGQGVCLKIRMGNIRINDRNHNALLLQLCLRS